MISNNTPHFFNNVVPNRESKSGFVVGETLFLQKNTKEFNGIPNKSIANNWFKNCEFGDIYLPPFCALIHKVRKDLLIEPFINFDEMAFPRLITQDIARRFGFIDSWPYILLSVEEFCSGEEALSVDKDVGKRILDPLQCSVAYAYLSNKTIQVDELPICMREELGGWSYRNEKRKSLRPILKAVEFLRNEYIFLATKHDVKSLRIQLVKAFCELLDNYGLCYRIVVGDGCFEVHKHHLIEKLRDTQKIFDIPVLDIELFLPESKTWLEILGASLWGTQLTKAFKISGTNSAIESGCIGIGISRFCYAILAQFGNLKEFSK